MLFKIKDMKSELGTVIFFRIRFRTEKTAPAPQRSLSIQQTNKIHAWWFLVPWRSPRWARRYRPGTTPWSRADASSRRTGRGSRPGTTKHDIGKTGDCIRRQWCRERGFLERVDSKMLQGTLRPWSGHADNLTLVDFKMMLSWQRGAFLEGLESILGLGGGDVPPRNSVGPKTFFWGYYPPTKFENLTFLSFFEVQVYFIYRVFFFNWYPP